MDRVSFCCKLELTVALVKAEGKKFGSKRIFTENHRMVEVGRDLRKSCGTTPLLKQGHLKEIAQNHIHMTSEYLQGCILMDSSMEDEYLHG